MRRQLLLSLLIVSAGSANAANPFKEIMKGVKSSLAGTNVVIGTVEVMSPFPGIVTCFKDTPGAAISRHPIQSLTEAEGFPSLIMTKSGVVTTGQCSELQAKGLLVLPTVVAGAAASSSDTGYSDGLGCTNPAWTKDEIVKRRREIMDCQADAITERAAQRQQAKHQATTGEQPYTPEYTYTDRWGTGCVTPDMTEEYILKHTQEIQRCQTERLGDDAWNRSQARLKGATVGDATAATSSAAQQAAIAKLQQDTAKKFKAIQAQGATPKTAPTQSAEDLAWDGAKLCNLKPAYMMKLKEEAVNFVRIDAKSDKIILSELAGGARRDVAVDGNAFAQRVTFNALAIGQGGDTCGRAIWNAEAYKAASAAMTQ